MIGPKTKLTLQRVTETDDGLGTWTSVWSNVSNIHGVLVSQFGKESQRIGKDMVLVSHIFKCDYQSNLFITEKDRLIDSKRNREFEIIFVDNKGFRNVDWIIFLREIK